MTPTATALLGYAAWTLALLLLMEGWRTVLVLAGKKAANTFAPSGEDLGGFPQRLTRAHANCYENLPLAGAVLLYALVAGATAVTDGLALALLGARVAQSLVHLVSTGPTAVTIRFLLFTVQNLILAYWLLRLFGLL
jgi:uncharacterized MAPEG superfamily protein